MSFASNVKNELASLTDINECCLHAEAYGMLIAGRSFGQRSISLQTENMLVANRYSELIQNEIGILPQTETSVAGKITVFEDDSKKCSKILNSFGHTGKELTLHINRSNFADECCQASFLRGAFLSCGAITDPNKNYHLEFSLPFLNLSRDIETLLLEMGFNPKRIVRKGSNVIYFKESESIEDILTLMGATSSSLELMEVKVIKDVRNKVNRKTNCETANLTKTVMAACRQIEEIEYIESVMGKDCLPDDLSEIAKLRKENPDVSLSELGQFLNPPLSRSGVNHRIKRIRKIYENSYRKGHKK